MGVSKFNLPDHSTEPLTTDGARHWMECIESSIAVENSSFLGMFAPYASTTPDMKVNIASGALSHSLGIAADSSVGGTSEQTTLTQCAVQSVTLSAPAANPRIDRIGIDSLSGSILLISGTEAVTPVAPAFPGNVIPVCQVSLVVGQTIITNAHITDERSQINFPSCGSIVGDDSAFSSSMQCAFFSTAGTYNVTKPAGAIFYRIIGNGSGGGGGGAWQNSARTLFAGGGGGGGGGSFYGVLPAEDLTIVIGAGGTAGVSFEGAADSATAGGNGATTSITCASGASLSVAGGVGGGRGRNTPAGGTAGTGGTAGLDGSAGGNGGVGTSVSGGLSGYAAINTNIVLIEGGGSHLIRPGRGGRGGNPSTVSIPDNGDGGSSGFVSIEWF